MMRDVHAIGAQRVGRCGDAILGAADDRQARAQRTQPMGDAQVDTARRPDDDGIAARETSAGQRTWISAF